MLASTLSAISKVRTQNLLLGLCRRQLNGNSPTFNATPQKHFPIGKFKYRYFQNLNKNSYPGPKLCYP
jgi:hypothetical protein